MESKTDILVLPFFGQGHIFPCVELCKHFSSHNCRSILIIPSHLSSSIPPNLHRHHLVELLQIPASYSPLPPPPPPHEEAGLSPEEPNRKQIGPGPFQPHHQQLGSGIESFLAERYKNSPSPARRCCVVMDVMMSWSKEIFRRENIPVVAFFTSGACAAAMEHAAWKGRINEIGPGEARVLPGLPESVTLSYSDLKRRARGGHRGGGGGRKGRPGGANFGPPGPGQPPLWLDEAEGSLALLINTCDDLEGPFLKYLAGQFEKPVLGVGPLLPDGYWTPSSPILRNRDSRPSHDSSHTEDEVIRWLDSKPRRSVIYISFGSEVGPTLEEYDHLAGALGESDMPFIWVIQPGSGKPGPPTRIFGGGPGPDDREEGYYPHGLEEGVGDRGIVIKGWAPQLLILAHPSTGGFLSHCGWNSTLEAVAHGVPILAWPIRGDQFYNAKLVVEHLGAGHMVSGGDGLATMVKRGDIMRGIEVLMVNREIHDWAFAPRRIFDKGRQLSSEASLKALIELVSN